MEDKQQDKKQPKKLQNFSYSKLDLYEQCGFKYRLMYEDGHYIYSNSIATEFGSLVHATEESIARSIQEGQPINYTTLKNNFILKMVDFEKTYNKEFKDFDKSDRTYTEKMYYYLEHGIYRFEKFMKDHPSYKIIGIEQKFELEYKEKNFKGAIDRVLYDTATGNYIIQDIKTWPIPADHKTLVTPLQFVFYSLAAVNLWKCDLSKIYCQYDLPLCDEIQDAGTKGFMARGLKKIDSHLANIKDKKFEPNPSPLCHWCCYCPTNENQPAAAKNLCPYYSLWTKENKTFTTAAEWHGPEAHKKVLEDYINDQKLKEKLRENIV